LSQEQLRKVLEHKGLIEGWLSSVETVVRERLEAGQDFPGFKIVEGRSLRRWGDESEAERVLSDLLGDNLYKKTMVSPAQAEKVLKKEQRSVLEGLVVKPAGKPTLAPEIDKRPPINLTDEDFEDVSDT